MTAAAIKATWATYKPVPTRNVLQLTLEVPLEQQADVFEKLGYPVPGTETWVGVALLKPSSTDKPGQSSQAAGQEKGRRRFDELPRSQQAALMCEREDFRNWLSRGMDELTAEDAAKVLRFDCNVPSRSALDKDETAAKRWDSILANFRQATGQMAEMRS